jgi:hypothetical protein
MPFPPAHKRVSFVGTLHDGEIFSFSLADSGPLSVPATAQAAQGPGQTIFGAPAANLMATATLTHVICEAINSAGKVTSSFAQPCQPGVVGASLGAKWNVLCQALTLETATGNGHGRTVRGRFYPPAYCDGTGATASTGDTEAYAQTWRSFVIQLNNAGLVVCVASVTDGGQLAPVTALTADNVIDTQRRRKNAVKGTRSPLEPV